MNPDVETPIKICYMRARSNQACLNIPKRMKDIMLLHAVWYVMQTRSLQVIEIKGERKPSIVHILGILPKWAKKKKGMG